MTRSPAAAATAASPPAASTPGAPPAPRLALAWAALVYAVCTLALGFPALAGKFLVNPRSDQYIAGYAFREFARAHWEQYGAIPQWNPYLFGGMPFVDAMHGDTFYPTALLRILIGTDAGMTWGFMIHVFLAGLFTFVFLRSLGLSFAAALVGGIAYQMGGNVAGLVSPGHDGKLFIAAWLPMALFLVVRGVRDGKHWVWGPLAIVVGLAVLSPHPQLLQYMLLCTGAFALFLALGWGSEAPADRSRGLKRLGLALSAVALGMVMGAIQYWPVKTYEPFSPRAGGKGWEHAVSYSLPPEEMINFAIPQFSGILDNYWGRNLIHLHSEYLGIAVLVLAGLAFGASGDRTRRRLVWFWAGAFVITLLWALGGYTPFYALVYAIVPGTKYFRAPSTMLYIVSFCVAVLAAYGCDRAMRGEVRRSYLIAWVAVGVVFALLGVSGGLTNLALTIAIPQRADAVTLNQGAVAAGSLRSLLFVVLVAGAVWATSTRRISRDLANALIAVVVAMDLWSVMRLYWQFMEPAKVTFASNGVIDYLKKLPEPVRVFPTQTGPLQGIADADLFYDGLMAHGVAQVRGYHGNHLASYGRLGGEAEGWRQLGNPNFWSLANFQYFITNSRDSLGIPGMRLVAGPERNAAGNEMFLWKLPVETSYAWVTPAVVKAPEDAVLGTVLDPRFDIRTAAIFDTSAAVTAVERMDVLPKPLSIRARVEQYRPGFARIRLEEPAPRGSALMVSENWYPGWTATVDGKPSVVARAAVSFMGVPLAEGAKTVELTFTNAPYETGKRVTWIAVLLSLLAAGLGALLDRRRAGAGV